MNKSINKDNIIMIRMDFKKIILRKLFRLRVIGGKHTAIEHLTKGLPKHAVGEAKNAVKELINPSLTVV